MTWWRRRHGAARVLAVGVAVVALALTGCNDVRRAEPADSSPPTSDAAPPSAAPSTQSENGLPTPVARRVLMLGGKGNPGFFVTASVYGIYRQEGQARLMLGLTMPEQRNEAPGIGDFDLFAAEHDHTESNGDTTGLALVDSAAKKAYLVASDAENECLCTPSPTVATGSTTLVEATFDAPPADVSAMEVVLPRFGVAPSVPVTDGAPPSSIAAPSTGRPTGGSLPPVLAEDPVSDGPATHAPVVDIETPVSNLDGSVTEESNKVVLASDVLFAFDKATLTKKAKSRIARTAEILRKKAQGTVQVNGYTDSKGSTGYNLKLSKRRAEAVRTELAERLRGSGLQLVAKGYGEAHPVAPNTSHGKDNPRGRALNRRVETVYQPRGSAEQVPATPASASPQPGPTGKLVLPKPIAAKPLKLPGVPDAQVELYEVYRHGRLTTVNFGIKPQGPAIGLRGVFSKTSRLDGNVNGVSLVDTKNAKRYLTARYQQNWFCTTWSVGNGVRSGQTLYLTATFAAPPTDVTSVDVDIPHVDTFKNVPVS